MQRIIVEPADVSGGALADLKSWLGISRPGEDALLVDLLLTALGMCESFTGQAPLSQLVEERLPTSAKKVTLNCRPATSISNVELVSHNGDRTPLTPDQYETEISPQGSLVFHLTNSLEGQAVIVTARVGIAETWDTVPAPLKQGIIRLCAYHYRDRDRPADNGKASTPPATISALWRPWQERRLT